MADLIVPPVLVVGAHPDDIEYGCGGTLLQLAAMGIPVSALVMSEGEPIGSSVRVTEGTAALQACGVEHVTILPYTNDDIQANQRMVRELSRRGGQPRTVFTLTKWDTHQDHRAVESIVMSAYCRAPVNIIGYATVSTTAEFPVNMFRDVSAMYDKKRAALHEHVSQQSKAYFDEKVINCFHVHRPAAMLGMPCVELFHIYRVLAL
jgi:LmbE family N-acetylglucosaminyl deacetylase